MKQEKYTILSLTGALCLLSALFFYQVIESKRLAVQAQELLTETELLTSIARTDSIRRENIDKVISVINRFNPEMATQRKYDIAHEITDAAMKYENLDVDLVCATITHESAFSWDPEVVSPVGALGLMQVMPATGEFLARIAGIRWTSAEDVLFDPVVNIRLGSRYLSSLIEMYEIDGGLAAYNGGGKRAKMWLAQNRANGVLFAETQNYVPAVLSLYQQFRTVN